MKLTLFTIVLGLFMSLVITSQGLAATVISKGKPVAEIVTQDQGLTPGQQADMADSRGWLIQALEQASGAKLPLAAPAAEAGSKPGVQLILTTASAQPELAKAAGLAVDNQDAYAIVSKADKVYLIGANPFAVKNAVARVLRELGFGFYSSSPKWHVVPKLTDVSIDLNVAEKPDISSRKIWYAYGQQEKPLMDNYKRWVAGNRLSSNTGLINTGHSYSHIINRNLAEFEKHPEYFALLENGERDTKRAVQARKFCYSNPGLIELVAQDRIKLLGEARKANPLEYMVSVDPSDGQGTCYCENCVKLGTTTDRVFHLANQVAKKLRAVYPDGWVGLYAYSSHRLPPEIAVEPNVYVQVALAFNRTQYTLPELVELWSKKVNALGLREYYGVEAWDWGLPGRMRGGKVGYHREWIPYYAKRKLNAVNAETNANWGGQSLGLFIAAELMWDLNADVDKLVNRYYSELFGPAAAPMKSLGDKFEAGHSLNPPSLLAMYQDLEKAYALTEDPIIRARVIDMMAYMVYVDTYRKFELVQESQPSRNEVYYKELDVLMNLAWRTRERDIVHYYALARRLCNSLPKNDGRPEFGLASTEPPTVWKRGEQLTDNEVIALFKKHAEELKNDQTPYATFSRYFEPVRFADVKGDPSRLHANNPDDKQAVAQFRGSLTGYFVPAGQQKIQVQVQAVKQPVTFTVYARGEEPLYTQTITDTTNFTDVTFETPKAGEYRFVMQGEAKIKVASNVPMVFEASPSKPAWIDYSGPHYFYVPKGVKQIFVDAEPRLSYFIPGDPVRKTVMATDRQHGKNYAIIEVPEGSSGKLWRTETDTRGKVSFLNIPPLLSLWPQVYFVPREVAELDNLTTAK